MNTCAWQMSSSRGTRTALREAAAAGLAAVVLTASGELAPAELSSSGRRELTKLLREHSLTLAGVAIPAELGDLADPRGAERQLQNLEAVMTLARDLNCRLVLSELGVVTPPTPPIDPTRTPATSASFELANSALQQAASVADRLGVALAVRSPAAPGVLADLFACVGDSLTGLAADPAEWTSNGTPPTDVSRHLIGRLLAMYADDVTGSGTSARRVPAGDGRVDWPAWLSVLPDTNKRASLISRARRAEDAARAQLFLNALVDLY